MEIIIHRARFAIAERGAITMLRLRSPRASASSRRTRGREKRSRPSYREFPLSRSRSAFRTNASKRRSDPYTLANALIPAPAISLLINSFAVVNCRSTKRSETERSSGGHEKKQRRSRLEISRFSFRLRALETFGCRRASAGKERGQLRINALMNTSVNSLGVN